jgi:hypothetical protein
MPKAQVLVTLTAEALVDVPEGIEDVEAYCREHVGLSWGDLRIAAVVQRPSVMVEHFIVAEPETIEEEPIGEEQPLAEPIPVEEPAVEAGVPGAIDEAAIADLVRSAVRERATRLLEEVVAQVVSELEPLLERHLGRKPREAS